MLELTVARFVWEKEKKTAPPVTSPRVRSYDAVMYWCGGCGEWREVGKGATYSHGCRNCGESYPIHGPTPRDAPICDTKLIFTG